MKKLLLALLLGLVLPMLVISCSGNSGGESVDPAWEEKIKTLLLNSEEWNAEWHCDYGNWSSELKFDDHGKKFVVNIDNASYGKCKQKVTITSDGFKMAGCTSDTLLISYDPNDNIYPFKGDNATCRLKLKEI